MQERASSCMICHRSVRRPNMTSKSIGQRCGNHSHHSRKMRLKANDMYSSSPTPTNLSYPSFPLQIFIPWAITPWAA